MSECLTPKNTLEVMSPIMVWPFKSKFRKQIARVEINGAIGEKNG